MHVFNLYRIYFYCLLLFNLEKYIEQQNIMSKYFLLFKSIC